MLAGLCLLVLLATATSALQLPETDGLIINALKTIKECGDKSIMLCFKERALHYLDLNSGNIELTDGISLIRTESEQTIGRSLNDDEMTLSDEPEARENQIDVMLVDGVARFLASHTLQFRVPKESIQDMQRALEETQRKKKGKKKLLLPLLLLFKLKMAALLPLAIGFLALLSFKALIVGKIALLLSTVIGLKKLLETKKESFEVLAHPYSHDDHGFGRTIFDDIINVNDDISTNIENNHNHNNNNDNDNNINAQTLAYNAYVKP